jgi:hypothetical protein
VPYTVDSDRDDRASHRREAPRDDGAARDRRVETSQAIRPLKPESKEARRHRRCSTARGSVLPLRRNGELPPPPPRPARCSFPAIHKMKIIQSMSQALIRAPTRRRQVVDLQPEELDEGLHGRPSGAAPSTVGDAPDGRKHENRRGSPPPSPPRPARGESSSGQQSSRPPSSY